MSIIAKPDDPRRTDSPAFGRVEIPLSLAPRPDWIERPRRFLLLASHCGDDNPDCSYNRPCSICLNMCNVFGEDGIYIGTVDRPNPSDTKLAIAKTALAKIANRRSSTKAWFDQFVRIKEIASAAMEKIAKGSCA